MTGAEAPCPGRQARQGATLGQSSKRPQEQGTPLAHVAGEESQVEGLAGVGS